MSDKPTKQVLENCKELSGIIGLLAVDAETPADKMVMAGTLLSNAIRLYIKAELSIKDIEGVFGAAVPEYVKLNKAASKKK